MIGTNVVMVVHTEGLGKGAGLRTGNWAWARGKDEKYVQAKHVETKRKIVLDRETREGLYLGAPTCFLISRSETEFESHTSCDLVGFFFFCPQSPFTHETTPNVTLYQKERGVLIIRTHIALLVHQGPS